MNNSIDHTGIAHILIDDVLKIVSDYDRPQASRLKTYELELTVSEKIISIALIIFTLGIWRGIQNWRMRSALFVGDKTHINTAISAIRWGAARYLDTEDLRELAEKNKIDSLNLLVALEPKPTVSDCTWDEELSMGEKVAFAKCGLCHASSENASFKYLAKKLGFFGGDKAYLLFNKCNVSLSRLGKLDEADLKILDVYLKYRGVSNLHAVPKKEWWKDQTTCDSQFQLHLLIASYKLNDPKILKVVQKNFPNENTLRQRFEKCDFQGIDRSAGYYPHRCTCVNCY